MKPSKLIQRYMHVRTKRKIVPKLRIIVGLCIVCVIIFFAFQLVFFGKKIQQSTGLSFSSVVQLIFRPRKILRQTDERTNILVLGIPGGDHDGSDLTDTILVVSVNTSENKKISMVSVPRDIWSKELKDKINSAFHYGEIKKPGSGGTILSRAVIEDVVGMTIHYVVVIDFEGFTDIIDALGGIDVNVQSSFIDNKYPIAGKENDDCDGDPEYSCRYETVSFEKGLQHMNGQRALVYVRSRHATDEEGTDFARGRRQQEVMMAVKNLLIHQKIWTDTQKMKSIINLLKEAVITDLNLAELFALGRLLIDTDTQDIHRISIEQYLINPPVWQYGRYVLIPSESFEDIHAYIQENIQ